MMDRHVWERATPKTEMEDHEVFAETPNDMQIVTLEYDPGPAAGCNKHQILPTAPGRDLASTDIEWTDKMTYLLIELWIQEDVLHNVQHSDYNNKEEQSKAVSRIVKAFNERGIDIVEDHVIKKFVSLKSYYSKERCKESKSRADSSDCSERYIPVWRFYNKLKFLNRSMTPRRPRVKAAGKNTFDSTVLYSTSAKRSREDGDRNNFRTHFLGNDTSASYRENGLVSLSTSANNGDFQSYTRSVSQPTSSSIRDENDVFGDMVVMLMRKVPECAEKDLLKVKIQEQIVHLSQTLRRQDHQ